MSHPLNTIVAGDCIAGLSRLDADSIPLAFADPPFNIGYEYDVYDDEKEHKEYLDWSQQWIAGVHRVLKPDGTFWLAIGDEYAAELKLISQEVGFHCRSWVIWYYTFGVNCQHKFSRSHAHLFHFVKDPRHFTFLDEELENRIPSARQLVYNDKRANPKGRLPDDTWIIKPDEVDDDLLAAEGVLGFDVESDAAGEPESGSTWTLRPQDLANCFRADEDTWYFPRVAGTFKERAGFHGCQMPEQLLGRIIRFCSNPGETVLDPFSGSATTLVVAKKLGRKYLGFELSAEYVRHGLDRLAVTHNGDLLQGAAEPTMSAPPTRPSAKERSDKLVSAMRAGISEAFRLSHDGYSVDRLVADPDLNSAFIDTCRQLGLVGEPFIWNRMLLRMRKAKLLSHIPTTHKSLLTLEACDPFLFASEIAWRQLLDLGKANSLDDILCDPTAAAEFDQHASELAPGFRAVDYRLGALRLRKDAKNARERGRLLWNKGLELKFERLPMDPAVLDRIPQTAGAYLISSADKQALFAGETRNLQRRVTSHLRHVSGDTELAFIPLESSRLAWQACLVEKYQPLWNLRELFSRGRTESPVVTG